MFANRRIRKSTQFGPVQGVLKYREEIVKQNNKLELLLKDRENRILGFDISDEGLSLKNIFRAVYTLWKSLVE